MMGQKYVFIFQIKTGPAQITLEVKNVNGQEMYRFEAIGRDHPPQVFLVNFHAMRMVNLVDQSVWRLRRRPIFIGHEAIAGHH